MKLYRPVLIETAEQAAQMPAFTVARYIDGDVRAAIKTIDGIWESIPGFYGEEAHFSEDFIGWTALVPIEAEEEWTAMGEDSDGDPWIAHVGHGGIDGTREEAEAYVRRFGGFIAHRALTLWEAQD